MCKMQWVHFSWRIALYKTYLLLHDMCMHGIKHWPTHSSDSLTHCVHSPIFLICFYTLLIPFRKFGPPYLVNATAAARAALPSPTSACWVFRVSVIHQTLTWTTYRILNMCMWSFLCERIYTHKGWAHRQRFSANCLTRKNSSFSCAPDGVWSSVH